VTYLLYYYYNEILEAGYFIIKPGSVWEAGSLKSIVQAVVRLALGCVVCVISLAVVFFLIILIKALSWGFT
jgi:hypothetical protein